MPATEHVPIKRFRLELCQQDISTSSKPAQSRYAAYTWSKEEINDSNLVRLREIIEWQIAKADGKLLADRMTSLSKPSQTA
jgi:hypothetical protein